MKKLLTMLLIASLVFTFVACVDPGEESTPSVPEQTTSTDTSVGEKVYAANIPEGTDFEGRDVIILTTAYDSSANSGEFGWNKDEVEATVVNEAIWNRNNKVNELLNCTIVEQCITDTNRMGSGAMLTTIQTGVDGGTSDFDIIAPSLYQAGILAPGGYMYNLLDIDNMNNVADEWWDDYFVDAVEINGKVFFAIGDIGYTSRQSITPVFFNKEIAASIEIENPYQLVKEMKWTIDVITRWSKLFSEDIDGISGISHNDKFGMGGQNDNMWAMFFGAGERIADKDANGKPIITIYNERSTGVAEKIKELMNDEACFINANDLFGESNTPVVLLTDAFSAGRSLLFSDALLNVESLRDMAFDFGILPCPLYDENQESYYSMVNPWTSNAFAVPTSLSTDEAEDAALVLQCLGAEGKNTLTPAYIEIALKGQKTRDDESQEMLDIIFNTVGCDIGHVYNWAGLGSNVLHATAEGGEFTSLCDANVKAAEAAIEETVEAFDSID